MKKFLSLLSVLCLAISGWAQTTVTEHLIVQYPPGTNVYKMTAVRNTSTFPSNNQGWIDFLNAIKLNQIERIAENGCPLAVGVPTPITLPTCSTTTAPSWVTGLRYKYESPQKLRFEARGTIGQAKFARVDGQAFTINNPGGVPITNDQYYGYGSITGDADGYDRQWEINIPAVALNVTFQKAGGTETYVLNLTPSLSAGTVQVIGTTSNPGSGTTTITYNQSFAAYQASGSGTIYDKPGATDSKIKDGEITYTVPNIPAPGSYTVALSYQSNTNPPVAQISVNGGTATNFNLAATGGVLTSISTTVPGFTTGTNSVKVTPAGDYFAQDKITVSRTGTVLAPNCGYTVAVNSPSTSCGGNVTLTATASGTGATGLTYAWTGPNNYVGSGASIAIAAAQSNGTYDYIVTATKAGCSVQATATVSVSGCVSVNPPTTAMRGGYAEGTLSELYAFAPFVPDQNQIVSWSDRTEKTQQNSRIRFGIHKSIGASITRIEDVRVSENMVNTWNRDSNDPDLWDKGRSGDAWAYGTPKDYREGTQSTKDSGDDTGYNGIPAGDRYAHQNPVDYYQRKNVVGYGDVDYTRTVTMMWSMDRVRTKYVRHAWYWLEGETIRYFYIYENNRDDNQMRFQGSQQELPGIYTSANYYHHKVELGSNGDVAEVTSPPPGNPPNNQTDTGTKNTTKNYMGSYRDDGYGITIFSPYTSRFNGKQFNSRFGNYQSLASSYINCAPFTDLDSPRKVAFSGYIHVGTNAEFKSWQAAHSSIELLPFATNFAGGKFNGWSSVDAKTKAENGKVVFYITDVNPTSITDQNPSGTRGEGKFNSQYGNWSASSLNTIYLNVESVGVSQLEIGWIKAGQDDNAAASQRKLINITNPNSPQTLTINMAGTSGWDGTIVRFFIGTPVSLRPSMTGSERFVPNWINTVNSAPAN
ncbi:carbohydrate-binding protein [Spirosoma endbachense]|uniref:CBM6 domain-containing protein n=1 Tax=Spirosoma endbachense TaxID=2666025 RepID=A0A6P1W1F1_9BACT|nr:hypothetical protein [Spirosoma endbachense]QHV99233.1 hypothetical protein GJR95_31340 [Spirosoma endbachense]